jgi:hypothetical protein
LYFTALGSQTGALNSTKIFLQHAAAIWFVRKLKKQKRYFYILSYSLKRWLLQRIFLLHLSLKLTLYLKTLSWIKVFSLLNFLTPAWDKYYNRILSWSFLTFRFKLHERKWLKQFFLTFLVSFKFHNFKLFMRYITQFFNKFSRNQKTARFFFKTLIASGLFRLKRISGFRLSVKGKMNRRPRAKVFQWYRGPKPPFQNLELQVLYAARKVTTYFGSYMFRFWLYWYV